MTEEHSCSKVNPVHNVLGFLFSALQPSTNTGIVRRGAWQSNVSDV